MELKVIQEKNLESRKRQLLDHLLTGWSVVSTVYCGDGWVEYVLSKPTSPNIEVTKDNL